MSTPPVDTFGTVGWPWQTEDRTVYCGLRSTWGQQEIITRLKRVGHSPRSSDVHVVPLTTEAGRRLSQSPSARNISRVTVLAASPHRGLLSWSVDVCIYLYVYLDQYCFLGFFRKLYTSCLSPFTDSYVFGTSGLHHLHQIQHTIEMVIFTSAQFH